MCCAANNNLQKTEKGKNIRPDICFKYKNMRWAIDVQFAKQW
jgi:hypothetical protein